MGREIRRVPKDWQHPKDEKGRYIPLLPYSYDEQMRDWQEGLALWLDGKRDNYKKGTEEHDEPRTIWAFVEWHGGSPNPEDFMPSWPESERTHIQMYEDCSEGTPISPVKETPEELARWLADTGASAFGGQAATYEQWLATCRSGWAVSAVIKDGVMMSGVAFEGARPHA